MSRIGKMPVSIPKEVKITSDPSKVEVTGPKGLLTYALPPGISISVDGGKIAVHRADDQRTSKALQGLTRSLVANMVTGVSKGYEKTLDISGVGFKAALANKTNLMFTLGFSHPVMFPLPKGITATVDAKQTQVVIKGIDKQLVGQMAANIRSLKQPEPYKGKGIKYSTEVIHRKEGKAGKGGK